MCGFCGIVRFDGVPIDEVILTRMRDTMIHRGPDDAGIYISPGDQQTSRPAVGLGHRRLAINDLSSNAKQPMVNENGNIVMVCNGEIYNFKELRQQLKNRAHKFKSWSDNEVILHLYEDYGIDCISRLRGMFSFAIWNSDKCELLLVRDRLGIKPFYYTSNENYIIFASEIKAILEFPGIPKRLNKEAFYNYISFGFVPCPLTIFEGIYKLEPGYLIQCKMQNARCKIIKKEYWDVIQSLELRVKSSKSEEEWVEEICESLNESVRLEMQSDVPIGLFLSGGTDSSAIAALMSKYSKEPIKTFTLGFKDYPEYNEFQYARKIRDLFKTEHYEIKVGVDDFKNFLSRYIRHQEEPVGNSVWMAIYLVAKLAHEKGVKVCLSGDGGDELFAGYVRWMDYLKFYNRFWKYYERVPGMLRKGIFIGLKFFLKDELRYEVMRRAGSSQELFWSASPIKERERKDILQETDFNPYSLIGKYREKFDISSQAKCLSHQKVDYLNWMTYISLKVHLVEDFLMRLDKMGMANSVEGRVPILDHKFVTLAMSIPAGLKYKNYEPKRIFKKAIVKFLPEDHVYRKKVGFLAPIEEWIRGELSEFMKEIVFSFEDKEKLFKREKIESVLEYPYWSPLAKFSLVNFFLWYREFIS